MAAVIDSDAAAKFEIVKKIVAGRLCVESNTLDNKVLRKAIKDADGGTSKEYWNALSNSGQLHGNVPRFSMIAICYSWLNGDS